MPWNAILVWLAAKARWKGKGIRHTDMSGCLNCTSALNEGHLYCPSCGQKIHESKLTVWSLIAEFFAGIFNIENNVYRSILFLPRPGFLSKDFIKGKRKQYLNPIRFFLVALVIHLTALNLLINTDELKELNNTQLEKVGQIKIYENYIKLKEDIGGNDSVLEQIDSTLFIEMLSDSNYRDLEFNKNIHILGINDYDLDVVDAYEMPIDLIVEKYKPTDWTHKLVLTQFIRTIRDPVGASRHAMGALIWGVLLSIFFTGLVMKLLYIRRKRYYVEHLIVLFHIHTFAFLLSSIGFVVASFMIENEMIVSWVFYPYIAIALYFFLSMKFYYQQGWIKTWFKFVFISMSYIMTLSFLILSVGLLSLLFFK